MIQEQVKKLADQNPEPTKERMLKVTGLLGRMEGFYKEKAGDAPERQADMFLSFVNAIIYANHIMQQYQKLTRKLKDLAEGQDDEKRTDSSRR